MNTEITLYNTLSRSKELFVPIKENKVSIYSCGPTVYHYAHLGNLRGYVVTDVVRRMFKASDYEVMAVINITDVGHNVDDGDDGEDKMEKGARREGKSAQTIAEYYTQAFFRDLDFLAIDRNAYLFPKATETILEQIQIIQSLEARGHTYLTSDGVYFDTSTFPSYTELARLDVEGLKSGARVEENKEKRNITDFALWKFSPKNVRREQEWDSPWGIGFPGWHIECSAMSKKLLGNHFDIHMGGIDHIPVHHTNEIAQSEGAHGEKYVNYWVHYNHLIDRDGKMAKSRGDFLRLQSLIDLGISPLAYRYYLLTAHYRSELTFSIESLRAQEVSYQKIFHFALSHHGTQGTVDEAYKKEFIAALSDDINTPQAIATLWKMMKDESLSVESKYATLLFFDEVLGLNLKDAVIPAEIARLLAEREIARKEKDFEKADGIRDEIIQKGFEVRDQK